MKSFKNLRKVMTAAVAATMLIMTGCGQDAKSSDKAAEATTAAAGQTGNTIVITLHPNEAPITCENFESLVKKGFYDGLGFHRVINGFMLQGGDPDGNGTGGPGYGIKGEFAQNGIINQMKHTAGVLSMARAMHPNSAGSQFFIMHKDAPHLDGSYAAFGKIIEGMDVVDKIAGVKTDYTDRPMEEQKMKKVTVETFGEEYPEPETM